MRLELCIKVAKQVEPEKDVKILLSLDFHLLSKCSQDTFQHVSLSIHQKRETYAVVMMNLFQIQCLFVIVESWQGTTIKLTAHTVFGSNHILVSQYIFIKSSLDREFNSIKSLSISYLCPKFIGSRTRYRCSSCLLLLAVLIAILIAILICKASSFANTINGTTRP